MVDGQGRRRGGVVAGVQRRRLGVDATRVVQWTDSHLRSVARWCDEDRELGFRGLLPIDPSEDPVERDGNRRACLLSVFGFEAAGDPIGGGDAGKVGLLFVFRLDASTDPAKCDDDRGVGLL
jgi:hypothetical protein